MRPFTHLLLLTLACCSLTACVGAGTVTAKSVTWDVTSTAPRGWCPIVYDKMIVACPLKGSPPTKSVANVTPDSLIAIWGAPDYQRVENGLSTLSYKHGLAWRGIVMFIVLPVPLVIPLGHNAATFVFNDDKLVHVEYVDNELDAAVCGLHSEGPEAVGCIAHWH